MGNEFFCAHAKQPHPCSSALRGDEVVYQLHGTGASPVSPYTVQVIGTGLVTVIFFIGAALSRHHAGSVTIGSLILSGFAAAALIWLAMQANAVIGGFTG